MRPHLPFHLSRSFLSAKTSLVSFPSKKTARSVGLPGGYRITAQAQCFVMVQKHTGPGPKGFGLRRLARRPVFLKHFHTSTLKP